MTMNSRKTLEKKQLKSLFWRSFTTSHAWHYERQQHMSFEFAMIPVINKLYDKEEDRIDAYKRHMEFYNCQTAMQPFICGVAAAMEEENANNEEFDTSSISASSQLRHTIVASFNPPFSRASATHSSLL